MKTLNTLLFLFITVSWTTASGQIRTGKYDRKEITFRCDTLTLDESRGLMVLVGNVAYKSPELWVQGANRMELNRNLICAAVDSAKVKGVPTNYFYEARFPRISNAGIKPEYPIELNTEHISNGQVVLIDGQIASVKKCNMEMVVVADTIRKYTVETGKRRQSRRLLVEIVLKYGNPTRTEEVMGYKLLVWDDVVKGRKVQHTLKVTRRYRTALWTSAME